MTTIPASQCALHSATLASVARGTLSGGQRHPYSHRRTRGVRGLCTCRRREVRARGGRVAAGRSAGRRAAAAPPPAARRSAAEPSKARAEAKLQACKLKAPLSKPDLQTLSLADGMVQQAVLSSSFHAFAKSYQFLHCFLPSPPASVSTKCFFASIGRGPKRILHCQKLHSPLSGLFRSGQCQADSPTFRPSADGCKKALQTHR